MSSFFIILMTFTPVILYNYVIKLQIKGGIQ